MKIARKSPVETLPSVTRNYQRVISKPGDPLIKVDVSVHLDRSVIWMRDLNHVTLCMYGSSAAAQDVIPLRRIKDAYEVIYWAVVNELETRSYDRKTIKFRISGIFNEIHRICVWSARRGITAISQITKDDIDVLLSDLIKCGYWEKCLGADDAYKSLTNRIKQAERPNDILGRLVNIKSGRFTFCVDELTTVLGFPVHNKKIPLSFSQICESVLGCTARGSGASYTPMSRRTLSGVLNRLNHLALSAADGYSEVGLKFVPFPSPSEIARNSVKRLPTAHPNLSLQETISLLREAHKWIEVYAPPLIKLYSDVGKWLSDESWRGAKKATRIAQKRFQNAYEDLAPKHGLPANVSFLWRSRENQLSLRDLLRTLQTACAVIIGINHGRRLNEVLGEEDRPYGIYKGCVTRFEESFERFEIRIWVEKTLRAWVTFSANRGVAQAVLTLEGLLEAGLKSVSGQKIHRTNEGHAKLFQLVTTIADPQEDSRLVSSSLWHEDSPLFFRLAGVEHKSSNPSYHAFRRMFAQIYYYRYENADIRALSQWLGHMAIKNTFVYISDPASRDKTDGIDPVMRSANRKMEHDVRELGKEYLQDCLVRLIEGHASGGGFSTYVLRIYRVLLKKVKFRGTPIEHAEMLADWFIERGYEPEPFPHGACLAGQNTFSRSKGKCWDSANQVLNKARASPVFCCGCRHLYTNRGYLDVDREELHRLQKMQDDETSPSDVRAAAKASQDMLINIIELETKMQKGNQETMSRLLARISKEVTEPSCA